MKVYLDGQTFEIPAGRAYSVNMQGQLYITGQNDKNEIIPVAIFAEWDCVFMTEVIIEPVT